MVWCIEACDFEVDVDLLFNENLQIGQKITLTEKIVAVLLSMKCPHALEPHQIQGLDYINIFPVVQWLVKKSVQNRTEKADKLKIFATNQFHNHFQLESEKKLVEKKEKVLAIVKEIDGRFQPKRHFKRIAGDLEEKNMVNLTLMEYMDKQHLKKYLSARADEPGTSSMETKEEQILAMSSLQPQETIDEIPDLELDESERGEILEHYKSLKLELEDTQALSKQNHLNTLRATSKAYKMKFERIEKENQELKEQNEQEIEVLKQAQSKQEVLEERIGLLKQKLKESEASQQIQELIKENEKLSQEEVAFKDDCRKQLVELQEKIENFQPPRDEDLEDYLRQLEEHEQVFKQARIQLAKKNRAVLSVQRQLDNIPDNSELSQYQRRFLELYNQICVKHKETKQFFALYNTLNDIKTYLEKEIALLNNICENYERAYDSQAGRTQFIQKFEEIVGSVDKTKLKIKGKYDDEKKVRDDYNGKLLSLIELQRTYALTVKQFQKACQRHDLLSSYLEKAE
jgi:hypothetical protein